ncbi:MAG: hypothetical protein MI802_01250, partial [Desulfobacterales bacterium]|nr:hypothetical protein [Desulfobacterales bacterium]
MTKISILVISPQQHSKTQKQTGENMATVDQGKRGYKKIIDDASRAGTGAKIRVGIVGDNEGRMAVYDFTTDKCLSDWSDNYDLIYNMRDRLTDEQVIEEASREQDELDRIYEKQKEGGTVILADMYPFKEKKAR